MNLILLNKFLQAFRLNSCKVKCKDNIILEQSTSLRFERPPLICVLFSLHFEPLDQINDHALTFKEEANSNGFPGFDYTGVDSVKFVQSQNSSPEITFKKVPKWNFITEDEKALIRLDASSMTLHLTDYSYFENSSKLLTKALEILSSSCPSIRITRYTLRYVNHIPLAIDESPVDWVNSGLLGLASQPDLEMDREGSLTETVFQTGQKQRYTVRCSCIAQGLIIPPDLFPLPLKLKYDAESKTPFVRIENSHSKTVSQDLLVNQAFETFSSLRNPVTKFFSSLTTPSAHAQWQLLA